MLTIGSFYRPPDRKEAQYLQELQKSISMIKNPNGIIWLGGDFNLGDIDWPSQSINPGSDPKRVCQQLIDISNNFNFDQVVKEPTRQRRILDLFFTNNSTLVEKSIVMPGISDHDGIPLVSINLKPKVCKQKPRKIYLYHKGDMDGLKSELEKFSKDFVEKNSHQSGNESVESLWSTFKENLQNTMDTHIPSKTVNSQKKAPWINNRVKRKLNRKHRAYKKARKSENQSDWDSFREIRKNTHKITRAAHRNYIKEFCLESKKQFWSFVKNLRKDNWYSCPQRSWLDCLRKQTKKKKRRNS